MLTAILAIGLAAGPEWYQQLELARAFEQERRLEGAESALLQARRLVESHPDDLPWGEVAFETGKFYYRSARLQEAARRFEAAEAVFGRRLGLGHHHTVEAALHLTTCYLETGWVAKAATVLRRHLTAEPELAAGDWAALTAELGAVALRQGHYPEAERRFLAARAVFEKLGDEQAQERIVIADGNLGVARLHLGRKREAVESVERAVEGLAKLQRPSYLLAVKAMANAAMVEAAAGGDAARIDELYRRAIHRAEAELGPEHYVLGPVLTSYAKFLRHNGRGREASLTRKRGERLTNTFVQGNAMSAFVDATALGAR